MTTRPEGYPLPWCDALDMAYWQVNYTLCGEPDWREWQAGKRMVEIIPAIDARLAQALDTQPPAPH